MKKKLGIGEGVIGQLREITIIIMNNNKAPNGGILIKRSLPSSI